MIEKLIKFTSWSSLRQCSKNAKTLTINRSVLSRRYSISTSVTTAAPESTKDPNIETGLSLTPSCIRRLQQITSPQEPYLRISISGGGCSGFQYGFEMDSTVGKDDRLIPDDKGTPLVVVDSTSLSYIAGSTVEYYEELIRTGFRIVSNPQAEGGCSCGASFSIKM